MSTTTVARPATYNAEEYRIAFLARIAERDRLGDREPYPLLAQYERDIAAHTYGQDHDARWAAHDVAHAQHYNIHRAELDAAPLPANLLSVDDSALDRDCHHGVRAYERWLHRSVRVVERVTVKVEALQNGAGDPLEWKVWVSVEENRAGAGGLTAAQVLELAAALTAAEAEIAELTK